MYRSLPNGLILLIAVLSSDALSHSKRQSLQHVTPNKLRPISISNYEAALGLQRRSSEDFSNLDLQAQSELIYGSPGNDGQLLLANMTLHAPDGLLMIMMERFEGLTSSIDCRGDDGTMSLTFNSLNAFNHALQSWSYINDNDNGEFLLIANHEGCGPDDQRQPYLISKVIEDTLALTTYLSAKPAPWSDVAGTYDMDFGQELPYQKSQQFKKRGLWGDIENVGKDVLDTATGSIDLSKTVNFPMNIGQPGQRTNIFTDDEERLTIDCINCFLSGSFAVTGHISVDHFSLQDLSLKGSPQGLQAALQLEATITSSDEPDSLQYTKELFSFPIPDAGIEVEGIFKLGATLSYDIGVSSTFSGSATVDFGLQAGLPDSAQVTADIQNPGSSSATGWSGGSLTPLFDIRKASASVKLAAFSQPKLALGIELIEIGNFDVALAIKLPEVSVTLTAAYDEDGVCGVGSSKTGVKLDSEVEIGVDLEIDAELGDDEDTEKPSWSHTLYSYSIPLGSMCFPLDIPGLNSSSTVTVSVPSSLASTSRSAGFTAGVSNSVTISAEGSMAGVTGTPSGSTKSDGLSQIAGFSASTRRVAPGASTMILATQSGQRTEIGPASSNVPKVMSGDSSVTHISSTVTSGPLHSKAKAVVEHPHTTTSPSSSDTPLLPGLAGGGGNVLDVLNPLTTPPSLIPTTFASVAFQTVAVGDGHRKSAVVQPHTSSIQPASSDPFSFPDLSGHDDVFAAIKPKSTTISPPSSSHPSSPSKPAAPKGADDTKTAVVYPKTTAKTTPKESSTPPAQKPKTTPPPDPLPHVKPAGENNIKDSPPKPKDIPPPPVAEKPVPVVPKTTSKRIAEATLTTPASGGGGCRMVKRFGKRMLVC